MILVTGAEGMTGSYVAKVFAKEELQLTDHQTLDVTDAAAVRRVCSEVKPDIVLHLAAATDVDRCEREPHWAYQVNVLGTQHVAQASAEAGAVLVFVSTSQVFDGEKAEAYVESDRPNPLTVYGRTKWEAEKIVTQMAPRSFIVRASWMIGGKAKDKKFAAKIVQQTKEKDEILAVNDKWGTITYAEDLLKIIQQLVRTSHYGLYHAANEGVCSRYDVALEIVRILKSAVKVRAVSSDYFPLPAPRSRSEAIRSDRLQQLGLNPLPPWQTALKNYLEDWLCLKF